MFKFKTHTLGTHQSEIAVPTKTNESVDIDVNTGATVVTRRTDTCHPRGCKTKENIVFHSILLELEAEIITKGLLRIVSSSVASLLCMSRSAASRATTRSSQVSTSSSRTDILSFCSLSLCEMATISTV